MKLWIEVTGGGRTTFNIAPDDPTRGVSFPRTFSLDLELSNLLPDPCWVAAALIYGDRLIGPYNEIPAMSPEIHAAMVQHLGFPSVQGVEVSTGRGPIVESVGTTLVFPRFERPLEPVISEEGSEKFVGVTVLNSPDWVGRLMSLRSVTFGSNATIFSTIANRPLVFLEAAIGILMSADWGADRLILINDSESTAEDKTVIKSLCKEVGVSVVFKPADEVKRYFGSER